jgi:hypothetical protein
MLYKGEFILCIFRESEVMEVSSGKIKNEEHPCLLLMENIHILLERYK